jgi:hypothetical protein
LNAGKSMIREFRLAPSGSGKGVSCDVNGAFVGAVPLLKRSHRNGESRWEARDCELLSKEIGTHFGLPVDVSSKVGGLKAICNALNDGDIARAQIATVLLAIPDTPALVKGSRSRGGIIKFIRDLDWSGIIKADWDADEHPRWPAGAPNRQGGQFAPKEEDGSCNRTVTARRKWMRANNKDWPIDEKTGRNQEVAHIRARADGGSDEPDNIRPLPHDEHVREHMERNDFSRWSRRRGKAKLFGTLPETDPKVESESSPKSAPTTTPKPSRATPPNVASKPTPEGAPVLEEPPTLDETILEDIPFIIPE